MTIEKLKLPRGRIVGGHPVRPEKKMNFQTKQPVIGADGQPVLQYRIELAIPKNDFLQNVWPYMVQETATMFPINPQTGQPNVNRDFSWKMVDGDSAECPKGSKIPYNTRSGYPGHYVLTVKTEAFAPNCVVFKNGAYHNVEENQIKCGDYVIANVNFAVHSNNDGGIYINPNGFELVAIGDAILTGGGGNPEALFGDAATRTDVGFQGNLPQAGQVAPSANAGMPPQAYPQAPVPTMGMPAAPAPAAVPYQVNPAPTMPQATTAHPSNPAAPMAPAHDFVQNAITGNFPVANAGMPPQAYPQAGTVTAAPVTSYPSNPTSTVPGLPVR